MIPFQSVFLGNYREFKTSAMGDLLMRLISLPTSGDFENGSDEMRNLNKIMRDLNVGENLPESAICYDQVRV